MKKIIIPIIVVVIVILFVGNKSEETPVINVQAASSMQNALSEIEANFEQLGYNVQINYGGSGTLVTQIQEGAPADIFISAAQSNFDTLKETNSMVEETVLVDNQLVLITNKDSGIDDISEAKTIAIGTPESVPAGSYAMQVLDNMGMTNDVSDKLVQTKDVSEVLTYVETGDADVGFVYNTDAISSDEVKVIAEYDTSLHDPITYPVGLLTDNPDAKAFYDYLQTAEAQDILLKYGFSAHE